MSLRKNSEGTVIKAGVLLKNAVIKRRTFHAENYKQRLFELTERTLAYYEGDLRNKGKKKGSISVVSMKVVMEVEDKQLEGKDNVFQIVFQEENDLYTMYVIANSDSERKAWLEAIRSCAQRCRAEFHNKYHPGVWTKKKPTYNCCDQRDRKAVGCKRVDFLEDNVVQRPPLPPVPPPRPEAAPPKEYIAMYDFDPTDERGLQLIAGEKYIIINDEAENWWKAENSLGEQGYIPSNYIKPNIGLEKFEWYYKDYSREQCKSILMETAREGCFLVRDSVSHPGEYTLVLFTSENNGNVRQYQIHKVVHNEKEKYYISDQYTHDSIPELIFYHKHNAGGLYTRLREPPPRGFKPSTAGFSHDKWKLDPRNLHKERELGRGCFGIVYKGTYLNGKKEIPVAIKEMTVRPTSDEVIQEFKTMTQLSHPNLVQLYGVVLDVQPGEPQMIITELLPNGALNQYLKTHKKELFYRLNTLLEYAVQVCQGMEYLEQRKIIHRDLAARNCLVGHDNRVKVGDFGLARMVLDDDEYQMSQGSKFPFKWAPPEVLCHRIFSSKSDIWAFGVLMWEIFSFGEMPYPRMQNEEVVKFVAEEGRRMQQPKCASEQVYRIMMKCWAEEPSYRPTFVQLRRDLEGMGSRGEYIQTEISPR